MHPCSFCRPIENRFLEPRDFFPGEIFEIAMKQETKMLKFIADFYRQSMKGKILTCIFMLIAACGSSFAFAKTDIQVTSNVNGAWVTIDGRSVGYAPVVVDAQIGRYYTVEVGASGYKTAVYKNCIILEGNSRLNIYAKLERVESTGSITVKTPNVTGAQVYLDGNYKGYAPITIPNVKAGYHRVKVVKQNCKDETKDINVLPGEDSLWNVTMSQTKLEVKVTNVKDVQIYLDGVYKGTGSMTITDIKPGPHTLRASKGRFDDEILHFRISAGETKTASITMNAAALEVKSNVSGASIYLDGTYMGTTPATLKDLEPGLHTVKLSKTHYETESDTVELTGGYISTSDFYLEKISGFLTVNTDPYDASVSLNGKEISKNRYELDEGVYSIRIKAFGYEELEDTVRIERNRILTVDEILDRAQFRISSFIASAREFNPSNKKISNSIRFSWNVNAPASGWIEIKDEYGDVLCTLEANISSSSGGITWSGLIGGIPISDGNYTATLKAEGESRSVSFRVNSEIKDYEQVSKGPGIHFDVGKSFGNNTDGLNVGASLFYGGEHVYGGVGTNILFLDTPAGNPITGSEDKLVLADFELQLGASMNIYMARPFIQAGVGFYTGTVTTNPSIDAPSGLSLSASCGCDLVFDMFNIGGFYKLIYLNNADLINTFGFTVGISFN